MKYFPFVSIIIPTYNRSHLLPLTLESFIAQDYPSDRFEIIVADNNSTDTTRDVVAQYIGNSEVPVIFLFEKRQGVHYARNSAALRAHGDIFYFTDDDMVADPNLLANLVQVFSYDSSIGSATGKILPRFEVPPPQWVERHLINGYLSLTDPVRTEQLVISTSVDMVYSCHQAVLRDVFFKAGGYNPENTAGTWIGDGETGLNIKISALGYRFAYTSSSVIYHVIPGNRMTLGYLVRRVGNQGFCDSFTEYRKHRRRGKIIPAMIYRSTIGALMLFVMTIGKVILGIEPWQFIPARITYLYNRNRYDLKLFLNDDFRNSVEIDDWLNNDSNCLLSRLLH